MISPYRSHRRGKFALAVALPLMLLACSPAPESETPVEPTSSAAEASAYASVNQSADEPTGGDGSAVRFSTLTAADIEVAALPGELGCHFSNAQYDPLFIAKGNVANQPSQAVIKVGDSVERLSAPGGFNAMVKGPAFAGRGHTVRITLTGAATGGGESPPRPATLTYDRADGAQVVLVGDWTCGP